MPCSGSRRKPDIATRLRITGAGGAGVAGIEAVAGEIDLGIVYAPPAERREQRLEPGGMFVEDGEVGGHGRGAM
jgi:hypothetical protein